MHRGNYHESRGAPTTLRAWNPLFSSIYCWSAHHGSRLASGSADPRAALVWKAVNPASWTRILVCPLLNTSHCHWGLVTCSYWDFSLFVVLCTFRKKLSLHRPFIAVSEVFTLQPFIGKIAVSFIKVLPAKWALFILELDFERSNRKLNLGLRQV